ncbi:MAG: FecR domain-containing protein [Alphaproteobacteria bacterium]|nr:FecR domain-containing protein [Alphaproteobacteria bacterium]
MRASRLLPALLVGATLAQPATAQQQAGVSAAVRGEVQLVAAVAPRTGLAGRRMASGEPVFMGDRIGTGAESGLQLMLLDETTLTIGPNSAVTVDEFVYDPARGTGKVGLSVTRGAFRFITGKVARNEPQNVELRTPVGTVGIRGTIVVGRVEDNGRVVVALAGPGPNNNLGAPRGGFDFITPGGTVSARKPGWGVSIEPGSTPRSLQFSPADLDAIGPRTVAPGPRPPAPGGPAAPGGPPPAPDDAGQMRAGALDRIAAIRPLREDARALDAKTLAVLLDAQKSVNGPTTFGELRLLGTGSATYAQSGVGMFRVPSGASDGTYDFSMTINFASRTYSGGFSNINVPSAGVSGASITLTAPSGGTYAFAPARDVASFAGSAAACSGSLSCGGLVQVGTEGGILARVVKHSVTVNNSGAITRGAGKVGR